MAHFDRSLVGDERYLVQIGTLSGNPVAAAAGLAALEVLKRPGAYEKVFATGRELMEGFSHAISEAGVPAQVIGVPPLFDVVFRSGDVADYRAWLGADAEMAKRFNRHILEAGVLKGESKFYVSLAHDAADVRLTLDAFARALEQAAEVHEPA